MPKITDEDDVNLDEIETSDDGLDPAAGGNPQPDEPEDDQPDEPDQPDEHGDDDPADDQSLGADEIAAARQQERQGRTGRENDRIRALNERLQQEREQRSDLQRRFEEFATRSQQQPRESQVERNSRRALMSETERMAEDLADMREQLTQSTRQTQLTVADSTDKSIFEAKAAGDSVRQRYVPKVEAELQRIRNNGGNVSREAVYYYLLGQAVDKARGSKAVTSAKAKGQARVQRETTRPGNSRNDAGSSRRGGKSLEDRLANVQL